MDSSSSELVTSDEELEEIIESAWAKTKLSLIDSESDNESVNENSEVVGLPSSSLFVLDTKCVKDVSDVNVLEKYSGSTSRGVKCTKSNDSDESDKESEGDDETRACFVIDKQPSLNSNNSKLRTYEDKVKRKSKKHNEERKKHSEREFKSNKRFVSRATHKLSSYKIMSNNISH